jgi:hypothetical protein
MLADGESSIIPTVFKNEKRQEREREREREREKEIYHSFILK